MTSNAPLISVCMPVYNAGRYVAEAVESILAQTLGDFELIAIDDGSTDGSLAVLRRYAGRDPRIRLTTRPNKGLVATLNELVEQSRGEFLARMDADDIALPERFEKQVAYLRAHPDCVLVGSRVWEIDGEGDPFAEYPTLEDHEAIDAFHFRIRGPAVIHPSVMMRRDAVLAIGGYRTFDIGEDIDLYLRLAEKGRLARVPEFLLHYRKHENSYSYSYAHDRAASERCYRVFGEIVSDAFRRRGLPTVLPPPPEPLPPNLPSFGRDWMRAWRALSLGHRRTARKYARRVLARRPLSPDSWKLLYCSLRGH